MGKAARRKRERAGTDPYAHVIEQGPPAEVVDPRPQEARTFDWLYRYDPKTPLWVSTQALVNLSKIARERGMSRPLDRELEKELDPNARHIVLWAARHWSDDLKYDNVRAQLALGLKDWKHAGADADPTTVIVDLPTRQFALLCLAYSGTSATERAPGARTRTLIDLAHQLVEDLDTLDLVEWTGTRSMDQVGSGLWASWHLMAVNEVHGDNPTALRDHFTTIGMDLHEANTTALACATPRPIIGTTLLRKMKEAHPIVCEPEWVQTIDDFASWEEAFEVSRDLHLPFDVVYLDTRGPGGYDPIVPVTESGEKAATYVAEDTTGLKSARLSGALLWRDQKDGDRLSIAVFGVPSCVPPRKSGFHKLDPMGFCAEEIFGLVTLNVESAMPIAEANLRLDGSELSRGAIVAAPLGTVDPRRMPDRSHPIKMPARILLPFSLDQAQTFEQSIHADSEARGQLDHPFAHIWASMVWAAARRVLRTMYMLQAGNVEIVEAKVSRQVRRAGERAGRPISRQVVVRIKRKAYARPPGLEEGTVDWTHAWWVSGHPRYYPIGTRKADAQPPDKLVMHPDKGLCFMEFVHPYVKGNREKGVVEKTRVVRDEVPKRGAA